jgi:xanthosine utilization system XapX-like protein
MITFILAAAVLVGAVYVAAVLEDATVAAPPCVAHVLAARLLATDQTVPVALGVCASGQIAEELDANMEQHLDHLPWRAAASSIAVRIASNRSFNSARHSAL